MENLNQINMDIFKYLEKTFATSRKSVREHINTLSEEEFISEWKGAVLDLWGSNVMEEATAQMKKRFPSIKFDEVVLNKSLLLSYTKLAIVLLEEYIVRDNQRGAN